MLLFEGTDNNHNSYWTFFHHNTCDENSVLFGSFSTFDIDQMRLSAPEFVSGIHSASL